MTGASITPEEALERAFEERPSWQASGPANLATLIVNYIAVPVEELRQVILRWLRERKLMTLPNSSGLCTYRLATG